MEKLIQDFILRADRMIKLGTPRHTWKDNIKIDVK